MMANSRFRTIIHACETVPGGPATYLDQILPHQISEGMFDKIILLIPEEQKAQYKVPKGVQTHYFSGHSRFIRTFQLSISLAKLLLTEPSAIVHLHSTFAGFGGRMLYPAFTRKARFIYCAHGWAFDRPSGPLVKKLFRLIERVLGYASDCIVCISHHDLEQGMNAGIAKEKLALVRNGVSFPETSGPKHDSTAASLGKDGKNLLFVGRLDEQKGIDVLCESMRLLADYRLTVVGERIISSSPTGMKAQSNIDFLGWQSKDVIRQLMLNHDILVVPSRWEGFGLVAAEALSCGIPVVASNVGGLPELVLPGRTGVLVEPGNPISLAEGIKHCDYLLRQGAFGGIVEFYQANFTSKRLNRELDLIYKRVSINQNDFSRA
jgi:glycosyltransferase involved in cell wall biosynthesis